MLLAQDSIVFKPGFHAQAGMRLTAKIDPTLVPVDQTDYIGGIEYRNLPRGMAFSPARSADSTGRGSIQAVYHSEGRVVPDSTAWRHEYVITDYLGNTRLRFSDLDTNGIIDSTELLSTHDYYPFGLEWNAGGYKYTYNGKEKNTELGVNWLDYGAREYDPSIGRWMAVDPLADLMPSHSGYNYVFNNPISLIDPFGLSPDTARVRPVPGQADTYEPIDAEDNLPVVDVRPDGSGSGGQLGLLGSFQEENPGLGEKWKVDGIHLTEEQFFKLARQNDIIAHRILRQEFGEQYAIDFMKYDVASAISDANDVGIEIATAVAPVPKIGLALKVGGAITAATGMVRVSKKAVGLRVGLGGSKKALLSTVLAYKLGLRGSLGRKVPTFIGPRASSLETALGRNAIPIGGGVAGAGVLIDELNKKK